MDMAAGASASNGFSSSHPAQLLPIPNNSAAGWQWNNGAPTNGAGTPSLPPPSTTAPPPPHPQFMSFDTAVPNAAAMAAYGDNFPPSSSIVNQQQRTDSPAYFHHQQQMHLQQQHSLNSVHSPSVNSSAPDFAQLAQPPHQHQQAQMNAMEAQQAYMRTGVGTPQATPISATMPPPYNSSPTIRAIFPTGAGPVAQRMPHPQAMMHPRPPGFPPSQPRFGLFVFHSDSANRAVIDVRRAEANGCQRWNSMCAWHMANMPPVNPFAMCRQGPSTSAAAPLPQQPSGNCGVAGHLSPMNPPPTSSTKSSSGGRGGTKRKALAQSVNATEPRHKSVSTPSPHFHSPLPQPLSVPTDAIVGNNWATSGGGPPGGCHPSSVSSANCNISTSIPQLNDPRRASSTAGEFITPPPPPTTNNGGEMCPASAANTLNGYSEQVLGNQLQNNNSPLIVKPPPAGSINNMGDELGDDPLKRLELMTSQSLCDMPLGSGNQQQLAPSSKPGLLAGDSASHHYAAALAEQRSKEQKLARLEQISQCLSSSDMSPPFGGGEPNGSNGGIPPNFRAPQLMQFPPGGGLPPNTMGAFQHSGPFPPGMAMRMPMPPHPSMQPVPPYMHNPPMHAHIAGIRQPIPDHHVYGGEALPQHQMNGGNVSAAPIYGPSPTAMNFPQPGFAPLHHHQHHNDISSMMPKDGMMQRRGPPDGLYLAGGFPGVNDAGGGMMQSTNCWPQTHQMPQPLTNLDARVPVKQMQYYPNSAMNNAGAE